MKLANPGTVPVYTVSGPSSRSLPDWIARKRKRSLKNDPEYANRIELLQDFEFEEAGVCIRVSEDGDYIMSTGTYKPQIHVHSLHQLSLAFSRHTISLNKTFVLCSSDYSKSIHLQEDRRLEFHTPSGCIYSCRIPRFGRDLVYDRRSTEALIPSVGLDTEGNGEVFRLNLELGKFQRSFQVEVGSDEGIERGLQGSIGVGAVNTAAIAENSHGLYAFGTTLPSVEFWDPRSRARVATLQTHDGEITSLAFSPSGLSLATGSSTGMVNLYDLRRPAPLLTKDHGFGFPIKSLMHLTTSSQEKKILSADKRAIKIFDEVSGDPWTSIEPETDINSVAYCQGSGMLLSANEGRSQHAWFIPMLGPAPKWCTFLDRVVEEMAEEVSTGTYDNYKFLTLPELKSLELAHLIGKTNLLRPYMHGYFVASKLYDQARLIANPYMWEEERMKRVQEKVEKERASRIRGHKKVKVNQKLVDRLLKKQERREKVDTEAGVLGDERFKSLFEDDEFVVDETSGEFRALNPSTQVAGNGDGGGDRDAALGEAGAGEDESEEDRPIRKSADSVVMRVSSSAQKNGSKTTDTAFGSRRQKTERSAQGRADDAVGEKQVTFVPESKKQAQEHEPPTQKTKRIDSRRSASNNTLRRL